MQLLGYARVTLGAGETTRVRFDVPVQRFAFSGLDLRRVVEPGDVEVWVASHAAASRPGGTVDSGGIVAHDGGPGPEPVPGSATERAVLRVTGPVREVLATDRRIVAWECV